jgi:hypothetical protein
MRASFVSWLGGGAAATAILVLTSSAAPQAPLPTSGNPGPLPLITLGRNPMAYDPKEDPDSDGRKKPEGAPWLSARRLKSLANRDATVLDSERMGQQKPSRFCAAGQCFGEYRGVASALYRVRKGSEHLPVFCVPARTQRGWSRTTVNCSTNWLSTLGGWSPWLRNGAPNKAPERGVLPPYACVGHPSFLRQFTVLPQGGAVGNTGFYCRNRVFKILAMQAEKSAEDRNKNIVNMCLNLRLQTWGDKYPRINNVYRSWCLSGKGPKDKSLCPRPGVKLPGEPGAPALPFMTLSREELLFFFGHTEFYCRADRKGLIHFLDYENHGKWAKTFTCGVGRGVLEGGPFEEGVQVCAIAPYIAEPAPGNAPMRHPFKARMHCWRFNRPTCEMLSQPEQKREYLHTGNLFDVLDTLKEYRRTRMAKAFEIFDLKDSEKLKSYADVVSFSDSAKDEGGFGIKEFCRFDGSMRRLHCGYTRESMARWFEMRKDEQPDASCGTGICQRGAYERGYYCGLFRTPEVFKGKPYWMCGLDNGPNGTKMLRGARAICVGGRIAKEFNSSKGDRSSLQCYERRFKWAESSKSLNILEAFSWQRVLDKALASRGMQGEAQFRKWALEYGHSLGHRTSMRIGLMRANLPAVVAFRKLKFVPGDVNSRETGAEKAKDQNDKAKELNDLVYEVIKGDRAADRKWWQEVKDAGGFSASRRRPAPGRFRIAQQVFQMFRVIEIARLDVLRVATSYAQAVYAKAATSKELHSRVEVHREARSNKVPQKFRGNVYCTAEKLPLAAAKKNEPTETSDYVCASSPLLVAGMVEIITAARIAKEANVEQSKPGRIKEEFEARLRAQVKTDWCYGGVGSSKVPSPVWAGQSALATLYAPDLSSPYFMEPGKAVLALREASRFASAPAKWKSKINWLKCSAFQYSDENWERAVPSRGEHVKPSQATALQLPPAQLTQPGAQPKSGPASAQSAIDAASGGDSRAKKAGEVVAKVGGLVGDLIAMVMPGLGKAISYISNLVNEAIEFIEEYRGKFINLAKDETKQWPQADEAYNAQKEATKAKFEELEKAKKDLTEEIKAVKDEFDKTKGEAKAEFDKNVETARKAADDARDEYYKIDVKIAAMAGDAKDALLPEKDKKKSEMDDAKRALNEAKKDGRKKLDEEIEKAKKDAEKKIDIAVKALQAAQKAYDKQVSTETKEIAAILKGLVEVKGSSKLFEEMLTDLSTRAAKKVMELIEPQARDLFGKGFRFVRMILGIVAKAIISALASIPFVGGVLAAVGQVAYDFALNMLEDFCFEQLKGLIERFFATVIRATLSKVMGGLKKQVMKSVQAQLCKEYGHLCPKQEMRMAALPPTKQWLERAFACHFDPSLPPSVYEEALAARQRIIRTGQEMERDAPKYARNLADTYFARFGLSYDKWMAAVGSDAREVVVAKAAEISKSLELHVDQMRKSIKKSRFVETR